MLVKVILHVQEVVITSLNHSPFKSKIVGSILSRLILILKLFRTIFITFIDKYGSKEI